MTGRLILYGAAASGPVAAEAAARERAAPANAMRRIPRLVVESGEVMAERAAMLSHLGDPHPEARVAPAAAGR